MAWKLVGASGSRQAGLVIGLDGEALRLGRVELGRHPALASHVLDHPAISRRHVRLFRARNGIHAEDLHSLNGTWIAGVRLVPFRPVLLQPGQELGLADLGFRLVADDGA